MLSHKRKILLAASLIGVWLAIWIWESWLRQIYGEICQSEPETHQKYCASYHITTVILWHVGEFLNYYAAVVGAIATGFIAVFTLTLKRSTDRLWNFTSQQARTAERAYTELERPYVYVEFPQSGFFIDGNEVVARGNLILRCVNHGRTPAEITHFRYEPIWLPRGDWPEPLIPEEWALRGRSRPPGTVAGPNGGFYQETINPWGMFSPDQLEEFYHGRGSIFVIGYVRYADAFGARHITGFNAALGHLGEGFVLRGDERYNYTRTERERPTT